MKRRFDVGDFLGNPCGGRIFLKWVSIRRGSMRCNPQHTYDTVEPGVVHLICSNQGERWAKCNEGGKQFNIIKPYDAYVVVAWSLRFDDPRRRSHLLVCVCCRGVVVQSNIESHLVARTVGVQSSCLR